MLYKCEDITPLVLQKALYYDQGFYYAFEGQFIFNEDCEAWVHGPVYRKVYNRYSTYRFDPSKTLRILMNRFLQLLKKQYWTVLLRTSAVIAEKR